MNDADAIRRLDEFSENPRLSIASVHAAADGILLGLARMHRGDGLISGS